MKVIYILYLTILSLTFTGCDETKKTIEVAGTVQLSGEYTVIEIGKSATTGDPKKNTFTALDKTIRGYSGCNSFFGNYTLDGFTLSFGDIAISERYCDELIMETERALLRAIGDTGSYFLKDKVLTLYSKVNRSVLLTAKKATTQEN